ncbi:MAG: hypothetical protein Q9227_008971 [Pyrenula ochraceoflavens]
MAPNTKYGQRLLPSLVDERSSADPEHVIFSYPLSSDFSQGFKDVTNRAFANAVNTMAWLLERSLGKPKNFEPIGYIGPADIMYLILSTAAPKAGYMMLLNSPRISLDGHLNVINALDCHVWATTVAQPVIVDEILRKRPMRTISIPSLEDVLSEPSGPVYPYDKTFEDAEMDPLLALHTSGSTGLPKPIIWRNASAAKVDASQLLPPEEGKVLQIVDWALHPGRIYSAFPFFHAASAIMNFCSAIFYNHSFVFGPASVPTSVSLVGSMLQSRDDIHGAFLPPSILDEMSKSSEYLETMKGLRFVAYAGGPLAFEAGATISKVCRVDNAIGSTEALLYPNLVAEPDTWNYFHFHKQSGFELQPANDGLFELVSKRNGEPKYHALHITFPDQEVVTTNDLYAPHPTKPGRLLYHGRSDDIIVLSNGEKFNPVDMEDKINGHSAVKSTLIAGQGRFQTCAIIELLNPTSDLEELKKVTEGIRPLIQQANLEAPAHARVQPGYILYARHEKPFVRAAKGTVIRSRTIAAYEKELDELYSSLQNAPSTSSRKIDLNSHESISSQLASYIETLIGHSINPGDDLFAAGLDSLLVLQIARSLDASLAAAGSNQKLSTTIIYQNPTVEKLTAAVQNVANNNHSAADAEENVKAVHDLMNEYTANLPSYEPETQEQVASGHNVILTGSTGSLGAYLLDYLLNLPQVHKIYCLNRSTDGRGRQRQTSSSRGLTCDWPGTRVQFLHADFAQKNFALSQEDYEGLLSNTTHIIHNQWPVNFNISLESFSPHILGVRHLIDFSLNSHHRAHITFVSSVATAENIPRSNLPVPEDPIRDFHYAAMGYGSSKLAAEAVLEVAARERGVPTTICRVGQISGPLEHGGNGMWNKAEWLPTIISTSAYMKKIPASLGAMDEVDWVAVDTVAPVVLEMAGIAVAQGPSKSPSSESPTSPISRDDSSLASIENGTSTGNSKETLSVYHIQNPHRPTWSSLLDTIVSKLLPTEVEIVTLKEWVDTLRQSSENVEELAKNPGIPLLGFYESLLKHDKQVVFGLEKSVEKSPSLMRAAPVGKEAMALWMWQWGLKGNEA